MADVVSSAVAQEAVNQVLSSIKDRYEAESDAKERMERMEMARIKLETALETSDKWDVTSAPLLRWRGKLKRAAQECDDALRSCKRRLQQEQQEMEHGARSCSSFHQRIAHAARSLVSSVFNRGSENEPSRSTVRRFEWFADGASEFMSYVELGGGAPRRSMFFFDPLVWHLLAGRGTKYGFTHGSQRLSFLLLPFSSPEHGMEGRLKFSLKDSIAPENNFLLALHLRLSESTDIVGVVHRCLRLFTPHLRSTAETVKRELTQLPPAQNLYWVPCPYDSSGKEHWDNLHTIFCKWFRQKPLCDPQYEQSSARSSAESLPWDVYLEPVTEVYLQGHVAVSSAGHNRPRRAGAVDHGGTRRARDFPYLKLAGLFSPHASSEDSSPAVGGSAVFFNGEAAQRSLYANISFQQLGEIMLPKVVDCLRGNTSATSYQVLWKSSHGGAFLRFEETSWRATNRKGRS